MKQLRRAQGADGAWRSHWWTRDLFATALGAEALATAPEAGDDARVDRAILWAKEETAIKSAFDLACFLSLGHRRLTSDELASWTSPLIALQREDGGWPGGAAMLFPLPWQTERREDTMVHYDLDGCFTTAMALAALAGVASQQRTAR
jgi:hypothetical protein